MKTSPISSTPVHTYFFYNIHNVITYVYNFDQSDKFQVVFEAHGSSYKNDYSIVL